MASSSAFHPLTKRSRNLTESRRPLLGLRLFPLISFPAGLHRRTQRIFVPRRHFLAALEQVLGALPKLPRLLLRVIAALIRFLGKEIARLLAGLRRKQDADQCH